ncbi:hypothetical protein [Virgisporangium aurantiacum]|uniref:Uncharacterized protein n=1 Tax=Virgisporangium aurantiacum TaxID=175570 RepID=A0A8J3Z9P6_9ACTN|nr:hypothetical protein [Virgisporangium aurantiacum]GIJ58908.1 hypothetical protein Vau01_064240 [Virgisporangium aurantiacum]
MGRLTHGAGDRLLGLFLPRIEANAAYQCGPTYQAGGYPCWGRGITYAQCECRGGRVYQRWHTSCRTYNNYTGWSRTNLAC